MRGLQAVVANSASSGQADVDCGGPTFKPVVMVAMKQVGCSDRNAGGAGLDGGKARVIVDSFIGQENFLAAAAAHVQGGKIIKGAGSGDSSEEQIVFLVPETVLCWKN